MAKLQLTSTTRMRMLPRLPATSRRSFASPATPASSPFAPRHLLSITDLTPSELSTLVHNAFLHKQAIKSGRSTVASSLAGQTIAIMFSKRSTRTRISTEAAITSLGGHPMFLGANDIQFGVNESLYDTSVVTSSMVSAIVARVHGHSIVADMAKHSSVPVINALSDTYHPLQTIADYLTIYEAFHERTNAPNTSDVTGLGVQKLKLAWVGDANNILYDLAIGAMKLGMDVSVATPKGYEIPQHMRDIIKQSDATGSSTVTETNVPEEAVKDADVIFTDTWVSMGQEDEAKQKMKDFAGFQVTNEMAKRGGAKADWKFMHCGPRHPEEVEDAVIYSPRSLFFPEAENRLYAAIAALESFVVNKGTVKKLSK